MKFGSRIALFIVFNAAAIAQNDARDVPANACLELNEAATTQAASGHLAEAEALIRTAEVSSEPGEGACAGLVLSNIARAVSISGRIDEAERLAEHSVRILERFYSPNDWMFLRPFQILAAARLESGRIARAREAVQRMQSVEIKYPEDRAIVHTTAGALLQLQGRRSEAQAEYRDALRAWEETGRSESADAAVILYRLGTLYMEEQRLEEARRVLDRALVINDRAKDSLPIDRIKLLDLRGALHARLGEWQQAEQDLRDALSIVDLQSYADPALLGPLLGNYSYVLRRNHHRQEARSIEARRVALRANRTSAAVVDLTELLAEKTAKKGSIP